MSEVFVLTGLRETVAALNSAVAVTVTKATGALATAGALVRDKARANMATRHYEGRAERITSSSAPIIAPTEVFVTVGIHSGEFVPEGSTFEFGWHSRTGKQPPVEPFVQWLERKNIAKGPQARQMAFAIVRNQKDRGYTFGEFHWLDDAATEMAPAVAATISAAVRL